MFAYTLYYASNHDVHVADMQNKQLMADKAYLEEQLKIRGTKKGVSETRNRQSKPSNVNNSSQVDQSLSRSIEGSKREKDQKSPKETTEEKLNSSKTVKSVSVVKKEINILDDLEKEFNKQRRQQQRELGSWHPGLVKEVGRARGSGRDDGGRSANASLSKSETEVSKYMYQYSSM